MDLLSLDKKLVKKYDLNGPRYTSYPTANMFTKDFGADELCAAITTSNQFCLPKPLSLYVHLPFCNTVCFYCACNKIITANKKHITPYLKDLYKEIIMKGKIFDKDRKVEQIHFGGGTPTYLTPEELESLIKHFPEIKRARFWMTFGDNYLKHLEVLENIGMTSIVPVNYNGVEIVPLQFLKTVHVSVRIVSSLVSKPPGQLSSAHVHRGSCAAA